MGWLRRKWVSEERVGLFCYVWLSSDCWIPGYEVYGSVTGRKKVIDFYFHSS